MNRPKVFLTPTMTGQKLKLVLKYLYRVCLSKGRLLVEIAHLRQLNGKTPSLVTVIVCVITL